MAAAITKIIVKRKNFSLPVPGRDKKVYAWFLIFLFFLSFRLAGEVINRKGAATSTAEGTEGISKKEAIAFKHFSIEDGLSQSTVTCIFQDQKGYMWFGTRDGLNKYDAYKFTVYKRVLGDKESLSDNFIRDICQDKWGTIWIATDSGGLNSINEQGDKFTRYPCNEKDPASISSSNLNSLYIDREGILWIGTKDAGLNKLTITTGKIERFVHAAVDAGSISCNNVRVICRDKPGTLWIGTGSGGLNRLGKNSRFFSYKNDPQDPASLSDNHVQAIYEDSLGNLWIGTKNGGINKFDRAKEKFTRYLHNDKNPHSISGNNVTAICEGSPGRIWIATDMGINILNPVTGEFACYRKRYFDPHSFTGNRVLSICKDSSGDLWFGTGKGIERYEKSKNKFANLVEHLTLAGFEIDPFVLSVAEDSSGILWIGTGGAGLFKYDRKNNSVLNFKHDPGEPGSLSNNSVGALCADKSGALWIGTKSGVDKYNSQTNAFVSYSIKQTSSGLFWGSKTGSSEKKVIIKHKLIQDFNIINDISIIYEDRKGNLWIGSRGGGLLKFDRALGSCGIFASCPGDETSLSNNYIRSMLEDRQGNLWVGTAAGLNMMAHNTKIFTHYKHAPGNPGSLSHNTINAIYEDKKGMLWLGTSWGLNRFDLKNRAVTRYFEEDGLGSNVICGILENPAGRLWISTNRGIAMLNTGTGKFRNYDVNDGLQSNEFNTGACFASRSGELFFGGINGLNAFYPENISNNTFIPPVVITGFKVFNTPVFFGPTKNKKTPPNGDVEISGEIELSGKQDCFSFEFAALNYTNPGKNKYAYRLAGFEDEWIAAGTRRSATYTGIKPGEYVFMVKGSNNDNLWNETGTAVKVTILKPWWRTPPAYLFFGFVIVFVFIFYLRWQRNYIKKREKENAIIRETRLRAEEAELQASVARARTRAIDEESKRKTLELEEARKFQLSLLPKTIPHQPHLEIAVSMKTAAEVGGDYYDFQVSPGGSLYVVCGDATGHGFKAGTMVSVIKTLFVDKVPGIGEDFNRFFNECSGTIKKIGIGNLYMALTMLKIDGYKFKISSAGMPPALVFRKENNIVESIVLKGPPLGGRKEFTYHYDYVHMDEGDTILLQSDGLPELFNRNNEIFGLDRVIEHFKEVGEKSPGEIISHLNRSAEKWLNYKPVDDDMTLVVIKFK